MLTPRNQSLLCSVVLHASVFAAGFCLLGPVQERPVHAFWMRMDVPQVTPAVEHEREASEQPREALAKPTPPTIEVPTEFWKIAEQDDPDNGLEQLSPCDPAAPACEEPDPESWLVRVLPAKDDSDGERDPAAQKPRKPAAVVLDPVPIASTNQPPHYPATALRKGLQGEVVVLLHVGVDGSVRRATIAKSSGSSVLDQAALAQLLTWRFVPGTRDGRAEAMDFRQPVHFRIRP